jgi:hypothetical protein
VWLGTSYTAELRGLGAELWKIHEERNDGRDTMNKPIPVGLARLISDESRNAALRSEHQDAYYGDAFGGLLPLANVSR